MKRTRPAHDPSNRYRDLRSRPRPRRAAAGALLAAAGLAASFGACGTHDESATPTTTDTITGPAGHGPHPKAGYESYCESYYHEMVVLLDGYQGLTAGGPGGTSGDAAYVAQVKQSYRLLAATAPDETKTDLQIVADHVQRVQTVAEATDWSGHDDVLAASARNLAWVRSTCGFDPANLAGR